MNAYDDAKGKVGKLSHLMLLEPGIPVFPFTSSRLFTTEGHGSYL